MAVIEVTGLAKTFRSRERGAGLGESVRSLLKPRYREQQAVKPLSFVLEPGEVLAFIGPNGAGKSTTIKMLTGILFPTAGEARVLGLVPWRERRKLAYKVASVFGQKSQLWYHLPPQDTFELLARIYELDLREYRKRRDFLIDVFEIKEHIATPARKLSLGERMRCELAAALLHKPQVLFLDEPTIGLDVIAKQRIRELIGQLNREDGVNILLTSHDAGDVEQVCRRAIVINHGEIILDTSVAQLKREYLRVKTLELLLDAPIERLTEEASENQVLNLEGVRVIKAQGYTLKIEIDSARTAIEPVITGIMRHGHILDMTITDPPMEEIIAAIYNEARHNESQHLVAD